MTTTDVRLKQYQSILDWLSDNLNHDDYLPVIRKDVSDQAGVPDWMVSRSLLILQNRTYVFKKSGKVDSYRLSTDFFTASPQDLIYWVKEYNENASEKVVKKDWLNR